MINTLWEELRARLRPSEVEEAEFMLGEARLERNSDVANEVRNLLELFDELPAHAKDLPGHKAKVEFYLSKLWGRAKELGVEAALLVPLKTPREKHIFEFLSDGGSTRPQTAEPSYHPSEPLPNSIDLYFIEQHQAELISSLDKEYEFLKEKAEGIQRELLTQASVPSQKEVSELAKKLEDAVVNEVHPELLKSFYKERLGLEEKNREKQEVEEEKKVEIDLEIPSPPPEVCKPKIRTIRKHSRPGTALPANEEVVEVNVRARGKISSRLRSMVHDHRDAPM